MPSIISEIIVLLALALALLVPASRSSEPVKRVDYTESAVQIQVSSK